MSSVEFANELINFLIEMDALFLGVVDLDPYCTEFYLVFFLRKEEGRATHKKKQSAEHK